MDLLKSHIKNEIGEILMMNDQKKHLRCGFTKLSILSILGF